MGIIEGILGFGDSENSLRNGRYADDFALTSSSANDLNHLSQITIELESTEFDTYLQIVNADTGSLISSDDDSGSLFNSSVSFTYDSNVNYHIRVTSYMRYATGSYTLRSSAGDLNASNAVSENISIINSSLDVNDAFNPARNSAFAEDYTLTDLVAGTQVRLNLAGDFDTYLQLVNADTGEVISSNDDFHGLDSQLTFIAEEGVNYIVRATSYRAGATGDFTLTASSGQLEATNLDASGINNGDTATSVQGTLDFNDSSNPDRIGRYADDYTLTDLVVGTQVQLNLNSYFDTYIQLIDADTGQVIAYNDDYIGLDSQLIFTVEEGTSYIVRATSYSTGTTGSYTLTASSGNLEATDVNNSGDTSSDSAFTIQGTLSHSDAVNPTRTGSYADDYSLTDLVTGTQVQLNLDSNFDTYLQLINADTGTVLTYNDDYNGLDSQLTFIVSADVNYIVRATSYGTGTIGDYTLQASTGRLVATATNTPDDTSTTIEGNLSVTDASNPARIGRYADDYTLTDLAVGSQIQLNLNGQFDTYLQLINADTGQVLDFNDDYNSLNSQLTFTVAEGVNYIARATSYSAITTGNYAIAVSSGGLEATDVATIDDTSASVTGRLDSTDAISPTRFGRYADDYAITDLIVGTQVQVNLGSYFDTYLQLINADTGQLIAFNDDYNGLNSQLTFSVEQGINYVARATSYSALATGDYTLTASTGQLAQIDVVNSDGASDAIAISGTLSSTDAYNDFRFGSYSDDYSLSNVSVGEEIQLNLTAGFDTYLQLINASTGELIDYNDDYYDLNALLTFTVQSGVDYVVRATSYGVQITGDYLLSSSAGQLQAISTIGSDTTSTLTGSLSSAYSNDLRSGSYAADYSLSDISSGDSITIQLSSYEFDTYLQIINADTGALIEFNDDYIGLNSGITFTVEEGVNYLARVTSFSAGETGEYSIRINNGTLTLEDDVLTPADPDIPESDTSGFNIDLNFTSSVSDVVANAFEAAVERWESIIVGDLTDVRVNGIYIDDVRIDVNVSYIDGEYGVLGSAGPTQFRSASEGFLPSAGSMTFDSADLERMASNTFGDGPNDNDLYSVVLHEMGHVFGLGTLWSYFDLIEGAGTDNPVYTGDAAVTVYNEMGGVGNIPLANTGGTGTADSHWRESVFDNEIMTGYLNSGESNPLSVLTIAALEDLGYRVDYLQADSYTIV